MHACDEPSRLRKKLPSRFLLSQLHSTLETPTMLGHRLHHCPTRYPLHLFRWGSIHRALRCTINLKLVSATWHAWKWRPQCRLVEFRKHLSGAPLRIADAHQRFKKETLPKNELSLHSHPCREPAKHRRFLSRREPFLPSDLYPESPTRSSQIAMFPARSLEQQMAFVFLPDHHRKFIQEKTSL